LYTFFAFDLDTLSSTVTGPNPTTGEADLTSPSPVGEENDRRCRPGHVPKFMLWFKLWFRPKLVAGIVELARGLIGPVIVPVDVEVN